MFNIRTDRQKNEMLLKRQKGAAAVEFAIILPILIVLLFGIVEFGLIFYNKAVITNASREGARYGIVFRASGEEMACSDITGIINAYTTDKLVTFGSATAVSIAYDPINCDPGSGNELTVSVSYNYDYSLLPGFVPGLTSPLSLTGQTIMVKE